MKRTTATASTTTKMKKRSQWCYRTVAIMVAILMTIMNNNDCVLVVQACTDVLVTPGASVDGSSMIAYNADAPTLYGYLYHYPSRKGSTTNAVVITTSNNGTTKQQLLHRRVQKIYDWDSGRYMGEIDDVDDNFTTYNVVGNANEHGLVIGETTFGGVATLAWNQSDAIIDYGSLIYLTLQRCKTVREAIRTMVDLMDTYGYASGGESFSLTDAETGEVWMMEVISTGNTYHRKGAVWVAVRIPDGAVAAHANHARITTFPRNDPNNCLYAPDVIDVAIHYGLYTPPPPSSLSSSSHHPVSGDNILHDDDRFADFSFSDVYDPMTFSSVRHGEARVWSIFSQIVDPERKFDGGKNFHSTYQAYAMGYNLTRAARMPLYVQPSQKLSVLDVMKLMNTHFEHTPMDSSKDVGSGVFASPYRPRPLIWTYNATKYFNERGVATAKTGWNFVVQVRSDPIVPRFLSALIWFACDDSSTSPRVPVYASATKLSKAYYGRGPQDGVPSPILEFDMTKAFWVQNMVSNFAYYRWNDVYPTLRAKIDGLQKDLLLKTKLVDQIASKLFKEKGRDASIQYITQFTVNAGDTLHKLWLKFYGELFVKYRDHYTITKDADDPSCGCMAQEPGLSDTMKRRIVEETASHYQVPTTSHADMASRSKMSTYSQTSTATDVIRLGENFAEEQHRRRESINDDNSSSSSSSSKISKLV